MNRRRGLTAARCPPRPCFLKASVLVSLFWSYAIEEVTDMAMAMDVLRQAVRMLEGFGLDESPSAPERSTAEISPHSPTPEDLDFVWNIGS